MTYITIDDLSEQERPNDDDCLVIGKVDLNKISAKNLKNIFQNRIKMLSETHHTQKQRLYTPDKKVIVDEETIPLVMSENLSTKINTIITEAMQDGATLDVVEMSLLKAQNDVLAQKSRLYAGLMIGNKKETNEQEIKLKDKEALKEFLKKSGVEVKEVDANGKDK